MSAKKYSQNTMVYKFKDGKVITRAVEYSVSYHCNLHCLGCSHMSPFMKKTFPSIESFSSDLKKLSEGFHAGYIRLLGGEPLLNREINDFLKIAKESSIADKVAVITNGILLHKMDYDFWKNVDLVFVTLYPNVHLEERNIQMVKERARESNTKLLIHSKSIFRTSMVTKPHPKDWITDMIFKTCRNAHIFHCHMIHEGRLYKCAVPPFLPEYLLRMDIKDYDPSQDAFDIHKATDVFKELKEFFLSSKTLEACRFCLGNLGKRYRHSQLKEEFIAHPDLLNIDRTSHLDRYRVFRESALYYVRRSLEKFNRKKMR